MVGLGCSAALELPMRYEVFVVLVVLGTRRTVNSFFLFKACHYDIDNSIYCYVVHSNILGRVFFLQSFSGETGTKVILVHYIFNGCCPSHSWRREIDGSVESGLIVGEVERVIGE